MDRALPGLPLPLAALWLLELAGGLHTPLHGETTGLAGSGVHLSEALEGISGLVSNLAALQPSLFISGTRQ